MLPKLIDQGHVKVRNKEEKAKVFREKRARRANSQNWRRIRMFADLRLSPDFMWKTARECIYNQKVSLKYYLNKVKSLKTKQVGTS